jgi:hypothetical protein
MQNERLTLIIEFYSGIAGLPHELTVVFNDELKETKGIKSIR